MEIFSLLILIAIKVSTLTIYNNYFLDDIKKLESILGRKMNWQE